jgi:hypothetical protein
MVRKFGQKGSFLNFFMNQLSFKTHVTNLIVEQMGQLFNFFKVVSQKVLVGQLLRTSALPELLILYLMLLRLTPFFPELDSFESKDLCISHIQQFKGLFIDIA